MSNFSFLTYIKIQQPFQLLSMVLWFETYAGKKDHLFDPVSGFLLNDINDATGEAKCTHTNISRDCKGTAAWVQRVLCSHAGHQKQMENWQCQHCLNVRS